MTKGVRRVVMGAIAIAAMSGASALGSPVDRGDDRVSFNRDIRPILSANCFQCHGPDEAARQARLRLDVRDDALDVIVPGDGDASALLERVGAGDPLDRMPPPETQKQLRAEEIALLRRWIDQGAVYEPHWSFIAPVRPPAPETTAPGWIRNTIDAFVRRRLDAEGLAPSPPASAEMLLRRVTFDLTGLPPTRAEIDAFLSAGASDAAYEGVVDRLVESPRFGERMAVPWLDVARYADSYGYQSDQLSPTWPYRDWVVRTINANLPFDAFIEQQLAGDLLPEPTRDQRLATAFNRLHRMTNEGGSVVEEWRIEYVADRVQTMGTAFLGLTVQCARCHDHKFDPITTREYYGLTAFFNNIDEWGMYNDSAHVPTPSLLLPTDAQEARLARLGAARADAEAVVRAAEALSEAEFVEWMRTAPERDAELPGLVGHYPLDTVGPGHRLDNLADAANPGSTAPANALVPGANGMALQFTGDDAASFPNVAGGLNPWEPFSVVFRLRVPEGRADCVIFHRTAGTDVGRFGTELSLVGGRPFFGVIRFWPGNAIAIVARERLATNTWTHLGLTYDGSGRAEGLRIFVNGRPARSRVMRDRLTKSPGAGGHGITFGERFRDRGLEGGAIDDLFVFDRAIAPVEVAHLDDGAALTRALSERDAALLRPYYRSAVDETVAVARTARAEALRAILEYRTGITETMVMEERSSPRPAYVLPRGAYDAPQNDETRVGRTTPASLPPMAPGAPRDRLGLARWLTAPEHPLTARVIVNRFWQLFFGRGLVVTSEDFGAQGAYPDHPELLDWLAVEFVESGWDVKHLCRLIVTSATYRQASAHRADLASRDPDNVLLARGPSRRLPAEMLRDLALAASGLLDETMGGPPVSPYQTAGLWREANSMSPAYRQSVGAGLYRRSLYTVWKRTAPMPNMMAFDAANREVCTARRESTTSPIQALILLNDVQFVEAARVLGERMVREVGDDGAGEIDAERIEFAFRLLTARRPEPRETALLLDLARGQRELLAAEPGAAAQLLAIGDAPPDAALDPVSVAVATVVVQAIMNSDATVWKR